MTTMKPSSAWRLRCDAVRAAGRTPRGWEDVSSWARELRLAEQAVYRQSLSGKDRALRAAREEIAALAAMVKALENRLFGR
jgi:hypothetical protein